VTRETAWTPRVREFRDDDHPRVVEIVKQPVWVGFEKALVPEEIP
jgi:hypothetical protein